MLFRSIGKNNKLLDEPSNHLQLTNLISSIAWALDDIFAQVFGNEHNGHVWVWDLAQPQVDKLLRILLQVLK